MKRRLLLLVASVALACTLSARLYAQDYIVYDPSNWYENVLQVYGLIDELKAWAYQFERLPIDLLNRYRTFVRAWPQYNLFGLRFAFPWLAALNAGDPAGSAYRQLVSALDVPDDILGRMPLNLRQRLQSQYGAVEVADRVAAMDIDQAGNARSANATLLNVIQAMQDDANSSVDAFQSQTALLTKINTASVLGLRIGEKTNEFLANALEQLTVDSTRRRQTEAALLNATIKQWRYGQALGDSLFQNTAANIDGWRLR